MQPNQRGFFLSFFLMVFLLTACGGGASNGNGDENIGTMTKTLSGVAAAGAPIVGKVNVKGANGGTTSSPIELDGTFSLDITDLTPPYLLYAEGTVNGKSLSIYSAAVAEGTINITQITDFILRNTLGTSVEAIAANWETTQVSATDLATVEMVIQEQLAPLLTATGVSPDIDLLTTVFLADQTGLDAVLDFLEITYDGDIATVTNNLTGSSYTDNITHAGDGIGFPASDATGSSDTLVDAQEITAFWQDIGDLLASAPSESELTNFFNAIVAEDYLNGGNTKAVFLDGLLADIDNIGNEKFSSLIVEPLDVSDTIYSKGFWVRISVMDTTRPEDFLARMVFDGEKWLWYGDGRWLEVDEINSVSFMSVNSSGVFYFESRFNLSLLDEASYAYDQGVRSAIVSGPGLPSDGVVLAHQFPLTWLWVFQSGSPWYKIGDDSIISTIPDNSEYTYRLCPESAVDLINGVATCTVLHMFTETNAKPPLLKSELDAEKFPTLTNPTTHNATDLNFGGPLELSWTNPPDKISHGVTITWSSFGASYFLKDFELGGDITSVAFDATGLPVPDGSKSPAIFIHVIDEFRRAFITVWQILPDPLLDLTFQIPVIRGPNINGEEGSDPYTWIICGTRGGGSGEVDCSGLPDRDGDGESDIIGETVNWALLDHGGNEQCSPDPVTGELGGSVFCQTERFGEDGVFFTADDGAGADGVKGNSDDTYVVCNGSGPFGYRDSQGVQWLDAECNSDPGADLVYGTSDDGVIYYREAAENGFRSGTRESRADGFSFLDAAEQLQNLLEENPPDSFISTCLNCNSTGEHPGLVQPGPLTYDQIFPQIPDIPIGDHPPNPTDNSSVNSAP